MSQLTIDGQRVECSGERTILQAADAAGIYIPRLCAHPDLVSATKVELSKSIWQGPTQITGDFCDQKTGEFGRCNLCLVSVEGTSEPVNACDTPIEDGMVVHTDTAEVIRRRQQALAKILADHPHACLTCAQKEGCSRTDCSSNVPVDQRCCPLLGHCELQKVSEYIGIAGDTPKYLPADRAKITDEPLFERDFNLCIGCSRCVRVCRDVRGADILGAVLKEDRVWVGTIKGPKLLEAECRFCGACVEVCPTGALRDKEGAAVVRRDMPLPCASKCPAGVDIPRYLRLVAQGRNDDAVALIRSRAPLPGVLGYICFHPCEDNCRRGDIDEPVAICAAKRFAADHSQCGASAIEKQPTTGKRVAVIGSGPAGLSAAYFLTLSGHYVEVFDRDDSPGGMLRHAIPDYRLPPEVLNRDLQILKDIGIVFQMNRPFGNGLNIDSLKEQGFNAILLAVGTSKSKILPIANADVDGIYSGLEFLQSAKQQGEPTLSGKVVIIGGGNVAIDAAMTAIRLGAADVHLVCLESREEMPAHEWEISQAVEEGITIYPSWGPQRFTAVADKVSGVDLIRCTRVFDDAGRFTPQFNKSETKHLDAESVIVTIGQEVEKNMFAETTGLNRGPGGTIKADDYSTGTAGVFAAGDAVRGPSSVIDALAEGRRAAVGIDKYLGGNGLYDNAPQLDKLDVPQLSSDALSLRFPRHKSVAADPRQRTSSFTLIEQTLDEKSARAEARRCLECHLRQLITPVTLPPDKWHSLNQEEIDQVPATEGVFQLLDAEKKILRISGTQNLQQDLQDCLNDPGAAEYFIYEEDPMYTKRESELIQQYLQEHGEMPGGAGGDDDLDDLF